MEKPKWRQLPRFQERQRQKKERAIDDNVSPQNICLCPLLARPPPPPVSSPQIAAVLATPGGFSHHVLYCILCEWRPWSRAPWRFCLHPTRFPLFNGSFDGLLWCRWPIEQHVPTQTRERLRAGHDVSGRVLSKLCQDSILGNGSEDRLKLYLCPTCGKYHNRIYAPIDLR